MSLHLHAGRAVVLAAAVVATAPAADEPGHLLAGATAYRAGRFDEALVEFQVALKLEAAPEARWYVAATLARLGRKEDALEAFVVAETLAPELSDAVLQWHAAMVCFDLNLLSCADARLEAAGKQGGPRLKEQAAAVRASIAAVLSAPPPPAAIDALLLRAARAAAAGRAALAFAWFREADALARRRADSHRLAEASAGLTKHQPAPAAKP